LEAAEPQLESKDADDDGTTGTTITDSDGDHLDELVLDTGLTILTTQAMATSPTIPDPREAALLAAQARIAGPSAVSETPTSPPPARAWTGPSEKQDRDYRIKLVRVIEKEVIGGNSYTVSAACIEVKQRFNRISNPAESSPSPSFLLSHRHSSK
jgi:hypothetical protein